MKFCTDDQVERFLEVTPNVERAIVESGIILLKYWLEVGADEQTRRLESRITDGRKIWKLSPMDLESYGRWFDYSRARDEMFAATDTEWAPWFVARSGDKRRARLNIIGHLLSKIPYEVARAEKGQAAQAIRKGGLRRPRFAGNAELCPRVALTVSGLSRIRPDCRARPGHMAFTAHRILDNCSYRRSLLRKASRCVRVVRKVPW